MRAALERRDLEFTEFAATLGVRRDTQVVAVLEYLVNSRATPRNDNQPVTSWTMPVSIAPLRTIVTDPRFAIVTSPEMIVNGKALEKFQDGTGQTSSGSGAVRVAPPQPTGHQVGPQVTPGLTSSSGSASAPSQGPPKTAASSGS